METRYYYLPHNNVSKRLINRVVNNVGCSIGEFAVTADGTKRVAITCNEKDTLCVQKILNTTGLLKKENKNE